MSINCDLTPSPSTKRPSASVLLTSTVLTRSKRQDNDPQHLKETHTQEKTNANLACDEGRVDLLLS